MPSRVLTLQENTKGRDFVVGDIHGAFDLLDQALLAVNFDPSKDRLIAVGDLVDRGAHSPDCLYYLAQPWFYSVLGNHEVAFMYFYREGKIDFEGVVRNIPNGMGWMLLQDTDTLDDIRNAFEKLPIAIELETAEGLIGFIHAEVPLGMDWATFRKNLEEDDEKTERIAIWSRKRLEEGNADGVDGIFRIFSGHTPVEGGPKALGNCFFIDTGAVFKQMDKENTQDLYMTLIDIKAGPESILNPDPTENPLIRLAIVPKDKTPAAAPKLPPPSL